MNTVVHILKRIPYHVRFALIRAYLYLGGFIASILQKTKKHAETYPIDFVVAWVDGNDPEWQKERNK